MIMSGKQWARQADEFRDHGKYSKVNPCQVCKKSSGIDYWSHPDTDKEIADQLICLCKPCYDKYSKMSGMEAIKIAFGNGDTQ